MDTPDLFTIRWLFSIRGWGGCGGGGVGMGGWWVILFTDVNLMAYSTPISLTEVL